MRWLVIHPSDEMYGADRVLLEVVGALGESNIGECWLPTDVQYPAHRLCRALSDRRIHAEHRTFPVLRRKYMNAPGVAHLAGRAVRCLPALRAAASSTDAVYLNTSAVLPMAPLLKRAGRRVIAHIHESWGDAERRLLGPLLRYCDETIAVSRAVADALPRPSVVLHNGFPDLDGGVTLPPADGRLEVLLASRWSSWKGHREFLLAWQRAACTDAHLTIVGGPPPGGEGVDVVGLVAALALRQSVTVLPERGDVTDLIRAAHLVVVPSIKADPLPTIAIEAARAGRSVLASDSGGLPEIVSECSGWLARPGDVEAWANALRGITKAEAAARGEAARKVFLDRFGVQRFGTDLRRIAYG
jgi:glycosyltransferase involved in cell wall biosynthesis